MEPSETLELLVEAVHEFGFYPILIIERFHSFASIASNDLHSVLSQLRTLEHHKMITTVALSPIPYSIMRRRFPPHLPFVNSVYGDNHDRMVMSPLTFDEFRARAPSCLSAESQLEDLYRRGGGPDIVYQALLDEAQSGLQGIEGRVISRVDGSIQRFFANAVDSSSLPGTLLLGLVDGSLTVGEEAFLRHLPQAPFFMQSSPGTRSKIAGEVLAAAVVQFAAKEQMMQRAAEDVPSQDAAGSGRAPSGQSSRSLKVLFLAANPMSTGKLDLEAEVRAVEMELKATKYRDRLHLFAHHAVTPDDLVRLLRSVQPQIVHFSGHGSDGGLVFRSDNGDWSLVSASSLARLLRGRGVGLVVLNACYSEQHAREILPSVGTVIGTSREVDDEAARRFSVAFYRTFGDGFSVGESFRDGGDAVDLHSLEDVFALAGDGTLCIDNL